METVTDFIFLGFKVTADGDCSHEIKRHLLLGRKAMINLESIFKRRGITLSTKVHLVKAMVFPVVTYGLRVESWAIKKAEHQRTDTFELCCWKKLLKSPLDCKEINPVNPKGNQPWIFIWSLMLKLKLQYFGHLMQTADSLEKSLMLGKIEGRRRGHSNPLQYSCLGNPTDRGVWWAIVHRVRHDWSDLACIHKLHFRLTESTTFGVPENMHFIASLVILSN